MCQTWKHDTANDHDLRNNFSNGISFTFNRLVEKANEWAEMEKAADTADTSVLFSQLVFSPERRETIREECYTHCYITTRVTSTSANSTNSAFSCYLKIFHSFIGYLRYFVANCLVLIFVVLFCICAISSPFPSL